MSGASGCSPLAYRTVDPAEAFRARAFRRHAACDQGDAERRDRKVEHDRDPPRRPAGAVGSVRVSRRPTPSAVSERLTRRLVDRQGGPGRAAITGSVAHVAAAFVVGFLLALGSTGSEPQRPAGAATALREATSPQTAARSVQLRAVLALPELRRDHGPRHALPSATTTASRAPSAPEAVSAAREASTPESVNSAPEPTIAPATPAPAAPAIPAPAPETLTPEPRERSRPQQSFDSSGEFDSSG